MTAEKHIAAGQVEEWVLVDEQDVDLYVRQAANSVLRIVLVNFHSATNVLHIDHTASNCRTEVYALAFLKGKEHVETKTCMHHDVGEGVSEQVVKFVLDDEAKGAFVGELKIKKDAQRVEAQQTNRNILLSRAATMRTQPQLEIYADDVKASHGATTGQLDESALFYMRQRGISPESGRRMLLHAFMSDIVENVSDEHQRQVLVDAIDGVLE